jgi:Zn-dependent metalloprotease
VLALAAGALVAMAATPAAAGPATAAIAPASLAAVDPTAAAADAADAHVASAAGRAALHRVAGDAMVRKDIHVGGRGLRYVAYERTYRGLPVIGGDAVVVTDESGAVLNTSVAQSKAIMVSTTARVPAATAAATAQDRFTTVDSVSTPRLVVLAWSATPALAWETVVEGTVAGAPSKQHVFVDAATGAVLDTYDEVRFGTGNGFYNGTVSISTSGSGSSFSMQDPTRPGIRCGGQNGTTFTGTDDTWGNGSGTNLETACVDALYAVQKEWDMLGSWLGRNGINGNGGGFPARVGLNQVNAFWNGSYTSFGRSSDSQRQATPIDVVAHEYGHAIFQTTPGGAGSGNENGGLNEATGDIFGALTEAFANNPNDPPDFLVGEEVNLAGNGPIRNMYNPSALGDPNCYSSSIPSTEVHAAAGPLNHWFYLLSQGSNASPSSPICSGGPSSVAGVGIQTAGRVYYNAMLAKTSSWRYVNVRVASLNAAKNLFPGSCTVFNSVRNAWQAVAVPAQSGEPTCTTGSNDFSVSVSPTSRTVTAGSSTTATVSTAVTAGSAQPVALSASGLPSGATASFSPASVTAGGSSTLTIGTSASTPSGTFSVTITGTGSVTRTASLSLTVTGGGGGGCGSPGQKLGNPGFESGTTPWTASSGVIGAFSGQSPHGGTRFAWLDGYGQSHTDTLAQTVSLPAGCSAYTLSFWLHVDSAETTTTTAYDTLRVQVLNTGGTVLATLATYSNLNEAAGYTQRSLSLSAYAGQSIQVRFIGVEDASLQTSFVIDDTALNVS